MSTSIAIFQKQLTCSIFLSSNSTAIQEKRFDVKTENCENPTQREFEVSQRAFHFVEILFNFSHYDQHFSLALSVMIFFP